MNGIALPGSDNAFNVVFLNLGYKARTSDTSYIDFNVEKTFCDYNGWGVTGKFNFAF